MRQAPSGAFLFGVLAPQGGKSLPCEGLRVRPACAYTGPMNTTYDQAQESSWAQDFESPSEREEREVIEAGRYLDIASDEALVEWADGVADDIATARAEHDTLRTEAVTFWYY